MTSGNDVIELVSRLARLGYARNRDVDSELREITITDDEAVMLLEAYEIPYWETEWSQRP